MLVYNYASTGEYISTAEALPDPLVPGNYIIPANATTIKPPATAEDKRPVFTGKSWIVVTDLRGAVYWGADLVQRVITTLGEEIPEGHTTIKPPVQRENEAIELVNGEWVLRPDYRGTIYWTSSDEYAVMNELGHLPEGATTTAPPSPEYTLENGQWVPPTAERKRAFMPALSARQFRIALLLNGTPASAVETIISQIPDPTQRAVAEVEWEYATSFTRGHELVVTLSTALGFTPEQVDELWEGALEL
ncbi:hypothetical protein [Roseibium sediminis]|uniref:hypothetical protein n=1 Tax=Roseibium sediminis TaxID=1775174 RepID=UPI00123E119B|nr:hypothetical protein [Roseibium sediminis]